jgi:hypothetical protein
MQLRKLIEKRIRHAGNAVNAAGDVSAAVSANVGESGSHQHVSRKSRSRIVQRGGRTIVDEHESTTEIDP